MLVRGRPSRDAVRTPLWPTAAVVVTLVLWSSAFVAIRHLSGTFTPGALSFGRLLVGTLVLGLAFGLSGARRPAGRDWWRLLVIGVLWYGTYSLALNAGEERVDAGTAAMLLQLSPVLVALLAALVLGERMTTALGVGLVVALAGVMVIAEAVHGGLGGDVAGVLLCLVASLSYSVSLIVQKPLMSRLPAVQVTFTACAVGMVMCVPFTGQLTEGLRTASTTDIAWVVYLGLFPTAIAFTTYAYALHHMTASQLGVTTYLVPPITVLMGWLTLDETPPTMAYAGGVLCLLGVALARSSRRVGPAPEGGIVDEPLVDGIAHPDAEERSP